MDETILDGLRPRAAIHEARATTGARVMVAGDVKDEIGWFVDPAVIGTNDGRSRLVRDELFGPTVSTFVYPDSRWRKRLEQVDSQSPYGSGTNDMGTSTWNLSRWTSARTTKEVFLPPRDWRYPSTVADAAASVWATS